MRFRYWMSAAVLMTALLLMVDAAAAFDDTLYPDMKGQWRRAGNSGLLAGGAVVAGAPALLTLLEVKTPNAKRELQVLDFTMIFLTNGTHYTKMCTVCHKYD